MPVGRTREGIELGKGALKVGLHGRPVMPCLLLALREN